MTNYRDKFLGGETVTVKTKDIDRRDTTFLKEGLEKVSNLSMTKVEKEIESTNFIYNFNKLSKIVRPNISYADPSTFAFYGSAKTYYEEGFDNITFRYPYDGSRNERISWAISASALDILLLQHAYPKTTGHVKFSPNGTGAQTASDSEYQLTNKLEYISFAGGPKIKSNYDSTSRLGSNLAIDPTHGNTVEFWLKKKAFGHAFKETILDIHTPSALSGSSGYGRFLVELDGSNAGQPITFSYLSSSTGFVNQNIGSSVATTAVADDEWHHYALSVVNHDDSLRARLYVDGVLNHTITKSVTLGAVASHTAATLGSLATSNCSKGDLGWGKLSGSLDDFRYWREERNPKQIGIYHDKPVYGGTINDNSNPELGVYFKFNEGISTNEAEDAIVLDYSGRINNGDFIGYTPSNRSTESAITLSTISKETESGDPIIMPTHPDVIEKRESFSKTGQGYDRTNQTSLAKSLPQWVYDEDVFGANDDSSEMGILVQAMAREFDTIKTLIDNVLKINSKDTQDFVDAGSNIQYENNHLFGCGEDFAVDDKGKRDNAALADFALSRESFFVDKYPISGQADYLEHFYSISEDFVFDQETKAIRDKILKNVHKNLVHIYKTKGTEESFRNMIRCFGVGDDLVRLNVYAENEERELKSEPVYITLPKKVISFENDNKSANIIQQTSSASPDSRIYISGTQNITPWTAEGAFIFPVIESTTTLLESSLYGASRSTLVDGPLDQIDFNVSAIKHNGANKSAYFKLTSSAGLFPQLTSSYFPEVYDNAKWNFAVIVSKESAIPFSDIDANAKALAEFNFSGAKEDLDHGSTFTLTDDDGIKHIFTFNTESDAHVVSGNNSTVGVSTAIATDEDSIATQVTQAIAATGWFLAQRVGTKITISQLAIGTPGNQTNTFTAGNGFTLGNFSGGLGYKVDFIGKHYDLDVLRNSFHLSASITKTNYEAWSENHKCFYMGAERTHLTGTVLKSADTRGIFLNVWSDKLEEDEIKEHAINVNNYGRKNTHTFSTHNSGLNRRNFNSLALSWHFDDNPTFDDSGVLNIIDSTSGSAEWINDYGEIPGHKYPGKSENFSNTKSAILQEYLPSIEYTEIDNAYTSDRVKIKEDEFEKFEIDSRPTSYIFSFEKSMFQIISKEMLNFVAGLASYNSLIGEPVNKYRQEYKALQKINDRFFSTVKSDVDLERFVNYYKWVDSSLGGFLTSLQPASSRMITDLKNVVESHAFERNKYQHPFPTVEYKNPNIPTTPILGINELLYDWEHGHNSSDEDKNCLWQKDRKEHTAERNAIRDIIVKNVTGSTYVLRTLQKPYKYSVDRQDFLTPGSNRKANKNSEFYKIINSGREITLSKDDIYEFEQCDDNINPQRERIYTTKADTLGTAGYLDADGDLLFPFTLYSSSAGTDLANFKQNLQITNNHDDIESSWAQTLFVSAHHGGMPHRRVPFGTADKDRPEAYDLSATATKLTIKQPTQKPKSMFYRDSAAGRLLNIANIKHTTGSLLLGNYTKDYEIVMTNGRRQNNNYLVKTEGSFLDKFAPSVYISGAAGFEVPDRGRTEHVIVNRFSAPGGPDSMGKAGMDRISEEYSTNNTVNYRNSMVRGVWSDLSSEHAERHGYRSGSTIQASVHMTNRNPLRFTGSLGNEYEYDNFFVQHPIPQNDFGYVWITASAQDDVYSFLSKNANHGHQHMFNLSGALDSKEALTFLSASQFGSYVYEGDRRWGVITEGTAAGHRSDFIPQDFVGLNTHIYEPLNTSTNILGYELDKTIGRSDLENLNVDIASGDHYFNDSVLDYINANNTDHGNYPLRQGYVTGLNALIHHRQGPYGWPSWKQIRGGNHPVMRQHRKDNTFSIMMRGGSYDVSAKSEYKFADHPRDANIKDSQVRTKPRVVKKYKDIPATSRFNAITMTRHPRQGGAPIGTTLRVPQEPSGLVYPNPEARSLIGRKAFLLPSRHEQRHERGLWYGDEYYHELFTQDLDAVTDAVARDAHEREYGYRVPPAILSLKATYPNDITTYSNREIIKDFDLDEIKKYHGRKVKFLSILETWLPPNRDDTPGTTTELREVNYIETLYPKEINTYTKNSRLRENFVFHGWDSSRPRRETFLTGNVAYGDPAAYSGQTGLVVFPTISLIDDEDFKRSSMGRIDLVNMKSVGSLSFGEHITASVWPLDARKDFTSLPFAIDLSFKTGQETFLTNNTQGSKGEGLFQNDYGTFAMGYNGVHGTPPISMTYNRRIPQEVTLYSEDFNSLNVGTVTTATHGWTNDGAASVKIVSSSAGNRALSFHGNRGAGNRRETYLKTLFTGSTSIAFDLMAYGGLFNEEYGITSANGHGSLSDNEPDDGDTFDVYYSVKDSGTWTLAKAIDYKTKMKDVPARIKVPIPVSPSTQYKIKLSAKSGGNNKDMWLVDNLRIVKTVLAGESKFQVADQKLGPFYDSYEEYREEIRRVGQDHSIVPEFRMSEFVEEYYNPNDPGYTTRLRSEFLSLTGAIYHSSSGDLQVGSQFFKTYGNSDFMKYFKPLKKTLSQEHGDFRPTRLTLRCQAAMKFLPYKGFFPAERVEQIGEIFARSYMPSGSYNYSINSVNQPNLTLAQKRHLLTRRLEASKQQVMKPFFGPGILNNSIKAGLAVDYPIFNTNFEDAWEDVESLSGTDFLTGSVPKTGAISYINKWSMYTLTQGDTITITAVDADGTKHTKTYTAQPNTHTPSSRIFRMNDDISQTTMESLKACIEDSTHGHGGKITVSAVSTDQPSDALGGVGLRIETITLTQVAGGSAGNELVTSQIKPKYDMQPMWHYGFFGGTGGTQILGITGSLINESEDMGIPRLSGSVNRRLTFEDMLNADDLYGQKIPDNEPHPEACLLYGNSMWNKVVERPPTFGRLDRDNTLRSVGVDFSENKTTFGLSLLPFKSAIHNFAAETVSFFMQDQKLETVMTPPIKLDVTNADVGEEYKMRVYLQNSNIMTYDRHSAFGPPVDDGTNDMVYYENTAQSIVASAVLQMIDQEALAAAVTSTETQAAVAADPSLFTDAAPTHAQLKENPYLELTSINGLGQEAESGKIYFFDPANYYQEHTTDHPATQASIDLSFTVDAPNGASKHITSDTIQGNWFNPKGDDATYQYIGGESYQNPTFQVTDNHDSAGRPLSVGYYDPTRWVRMVEYSSAGNPEPEMSMTFNGGASAFPGSGTPDGNSGWNAGDYIGFKITTTNTNSLANPHVYFLYYDSNKFTGANYESTTGHDLSTRAAYAAFSEIEGTTAGDAAICKYATKGKDGLAASVVFINVYSESLSDYFSANNLSEITAAQINGALGGTTAYNGHNPLGGGATWSASNNSGTLKIKFIVPSSHQQDPNKFVPVLDLQEPSGTSYQVEDGLLEDTNLGFFTSFVPQLPARTRSQWAGTHITDHASAVTAGSEGYIAPPLTANNGHAQTAIRNDYEYDKMTITEPNLLRTGDRYRNISGRPPLLYTNWDGTEFINTGNGSFMSSQIDILQASGGDSISAKSNSDGDYVIAFDGPRTALSAEVYNSETTRLRAPAPRPFTDLAGWPGGTPGATDFSPGSVKCNGFAMKSNINAPFVITFDYLHANGDTTSDHNRALSYDADYDSDACPSTRVSNSSTVSSAGQYEGYGASADNEHFFAQIRYRNASNVWTSWQTVMEIVPNSESGNWKTGGFGVHKAASSPQMIDESDSLCQVRFISVSSHSAANKAVWLMRNLIIHEADQYRSNDAIALATEAVVDSNTYVQNTAATSLSNVVTITQTDAGEYTSGLVTGLTAFNFLDDMVDESSPHNFSGGADASTTSVKVYYDVTGSQPGHDLDNNIRYCSQRVTSSSPSRLNGSPMRDLLKSELDLLNTGKMQSTLDIVSESTYNIRVSQKFGGVKGNNDPGPGKVLIHNGSDGTSATQVFNSPTSAKMANGAIGDASIQPVTRSVPDMHGFMPYVPPYLDKNASPYVEYIFRPTTPGSYNAIDIVDQLTASYVNFHKAPDNAATNTNYKEAMSLTASLDLTGIVRLTKDTLMIDSLGAQQGHTTGRNLGWHLMHDRNIVGPTPESEYNYKWRWVMRPRWETPIHDFKNVSLDAVKIKAPKTGILDNVEDSEFTLNQIVESTSDSPWKNRIWQKYYKEFEQLPAVEYLTASTGIWHQYGDRLKNTINAASGYYLRVEDEGPRGLASAVGFLSAEPTSIKLPGSITSNSFLTTAQRSKKSLSVKLGKIASKKTIKEAVVAIPYYCNNYGNVIFFDLNSEAYNQALINVESTRDANIARSLQSRNREDVREMLREAETAASIASVDSISTIEYQIKMMERYILPPALDFRKVNDVDLMSPFVMYFFEFNAELDEEDLSNIWQNIYPKSSKSTANPRYSNLSLETPSAKDVVYSSHILDSDLIRRLTNTTNSTENLSNYRDPHGFMDSEVRWLVLKCKYRAESDYSFIVDQSIEPTVHFERNSENRDIPASLERRGRTGALNLPITYNWPYDYFSFVELIKLESKVDFYSFGTYPTADEE